MNVVSSRKSRRSGPACTSDAASRASRSTSGSKRRRSPRWTISASSTSRATSGRPIRRSTRQRPPLPGVTTTRSPNRSPRRGLSTLTRLPGSKNGVTVKNRPCLSRTPTSGAALTSRHRLQRLLQRLVLARLGVVGGLDVGRDARALAHAAAAEVAPGRREVLTDGDVQRAAVRQPLDLLEDALAERARADDLGALAVLQRTGDDLRRARRASSTSTTTGIFSRDRAALGVVDVLGPRSGPWSRRRGRRAGTRRRP